MNISYFHRLQWSTTLSLTNTQKERISQSGSTFRYRLQSEIADSSR